MEGQQPTENNLTTDSTNLPPETLRRSTRPVKLTEKALQNKEDDLQGKFFVEHIDLHSIIQSTRNSLLSQNIDGDSLAVNKLDITARLNSLKEIFVELKRLNEDSIDDEVIEAMDESSISVRNILSDIDKVSNMSSSRQPSIRLAHSTQSRLSRTSSRSSRRVAVAAEAAALQEELTAQKLQNEREKELERMELEEEMRRKQVVFKMSELKRQLEEERLQGKLKAQEAIMRVYDEEDGTSTVSSSSSRGGKTVVKKIEDQPNPTDVIPRASPKLESKLIDEPASIVSQQAQVVLDPQAPMFQPRSPVLDLADALAQSRLPVPEPPIFTGDPLQYPDWVSAFTTLVERRGIPPGEKIHYLRRYLGGPAKEAVSGYFLMRSENAFEQAKSTLQKRFGNPFAIAEAFRTKLDVWPKITSKDHNGLQRFADFLQQCLVAKAEIVDLNILDDIREINRMVARLPDHIVHRWNRSVAQTKRERLCYPRFADFVSFIGNEADIANDPLLTVDVGKTRERKQETAVSKRVTLSTSGSTSQKQCLLCKRQNHSLNDCREFLRKDMSQRKDFIKNERLCYGCLEKGHMSKYCQSRLVCKKCSKRHPSCLHEDQRDSNKANLASSQPKEAQTASTSNPQAVTHKVQGDERSDLTSMIVPVYLSSTERPDKEVLVYALLDSMSNTTFLSEDVGQDLDVQSQPATLSLTTLTDEISISTFKYDNLRVRGFYSSEKIRLPSTFTRQSIPLDDSHIPTPETASKWPHLVCVQDMIAPKQDCPVGLLIGYNCAQALAPLTSVRGQNGEPYAVQTDLGWSIVGGQSDLSNSFDSFGHTYRTVSMKVEAPIDIKKVTFAYQSPLKEATASDFLQLMERDFQEAEQADAMSQNDKKFIQVVTEGLRQREDGFYEMPLPFKKGPPSLPNNRQAALGRLAGLKKQFLKKPEYHSHYKVFMKEILARGDAEMVGDSSDKGLWYIPHHGVYHPKKPGKVRVVFDCSARYLGTSLNDHLLQGPDLINPLIGVLLRFRQGPVAFMCDVEKMYHQFKVADPHQNYLRFLWWEDGDLSKTPVDHRMKVHLFGATSSPGCANFGLKQIAEDHKKLGDRAANFLKRNFYVDDGLKSMSSEQEAAVLIKDATQMCAKGNLRLHKFVCNSKDVTSTIPKSERATVTNASVQLGEQTSPIERALGLQWCVSSDEFCFRLTLKDQPLTRRGILATVASVYDPLGLIAPVVLAGRMILQEMCKQKMDWDHPVPDYLRTRWEIWRQEILKLETAKIPRCFQPKDFGEAEEVELHHFSDASLSGYGQCSYVRLRNQRGQVHCSLAMAKARVAPLKQSTVPRLELQAATLSAKVAKILNKELDYSSVKNIFWTDSKVVLGYLYNQSKRFHMFVANRVDCILRTTSCSQWNYVTSGDNPADYASRGLTTEELLSSNWLGGPDFLWESEVAKQDVTLEVSPDDVEVKSSTVHTVMSKTKISTFTSFEDRLNRFAMLDSAIRAVAVLVRCCYRRKGHDIDDVEIKRVAERNLLHAVQKEAFCDERQQIKSDKHAVSKSSRLSQLYPFLDKQDLLRVGGRMKRSEMVYGVKHPIILPKGSRLSMLVALHYHAKISHQGRNMTINAIRSSGYWIIGCRSIVSSLIGTCTHCIRLRGKLGGQKMADLPCERLEPSPPFTYCGLDCFGPFVIKEGRKELKRYGLILTCMAMRAIHVEVLDDMSSDAFINGLRCFIAIRGNVRRIQCDQGSNFVGAKHELKQALREMDADDVARNLLEQNCEFKMNPPSSSHMGGVWERQIRNVRNVLNGLLEQCGTQLNVSSLRTFLYEAMAIVNSRPLSVDNLESPDGPLPLTPNHVLTMKSGLILPPPGSFEREDIYLRKRWRRVQYLTQFFWTRWQKEYLHTLQPRKTWTEKKTNVHVDDIVLLKDEAICRTDWRVARVMETMSSDDGLVRKVRLLMATPDLDKKGKPVNKRTTLERPVHKLVVLIRSTDKAIED
ncbi:uncharacterized protein LOC115921321 [Strongylocentrotus purpuratus]|uniref:Integrase catalytic domain-containing protein n=1 Tax=Strongylocentrotus purpuratus TaxID=7668 RepID=A0A7M7NCG0_STRPU|nr:uncharacterized protein LOC115921321 [Strongylocentrotus purpuratus]